MYPFDSLPAPRQQSLIRTMPRFDRSGYSSGSICELDSRLLDVGLNRKVDFDMPLKTENWMKTVGTTSLLQEALKDTEGLLLAEWLFKNGFGKKLDRKNVLKRIEEVSATPDGCGNQAEVAKRVKDFLSSRK